jgi:succinyl-diaminopimelate desuccinylase
MAQSPPPDAANAIVGFARDLIAIPTENPPGSAYGDCVARIGA